MSKHQPIRFSLSVENKRDDAGTGRPNLSREPKFSGANGTGEKLFTVQLTTSRIGKHTRLIHILLQVLTMHTSHVSKTKQNENKNMRLFRNQNRAVTYDQHDSSYTRRTVACGRVYRQPKCSLRASEHAREIISLLYTKNMLGHAQVHAAEKSFSP